MVWFHSEIKSGTAATARYNGGAQEGDGEVIRHLFFRHP